MGFRGRFVTVGAASVEPFIRKAHDGGGGGGHVASGTGSHGLWEGAPARGATAAPAA